MSSLMLSDKSWKTFRMDDIFVFRKGKRLTKEDMNIGGTNFIGAIDDNNGIRQGIDLSPTHYGNCITVNYNGSVGEAFYQDRPFRASDDVNILYPKNWQLNQNKGLFLCTIIRANKYRFSYGRKWSLEKMRETLIALPVDKNGDPDWLFMDRYIGGLTDESKIKTGIERRRLPFDVKKWKHYLVSDLFDVSGTKTTKISDLETFGAGGFPYITTQSVNNGVAGFYDHSTEKGNVLVIDSAVAGFCSYQERDFSASDHVEKLTPKFELNKYIGLFMASVINMERYRYSYGRKFNQIKIRDTKIKLPVDNSTGNPDWVRMESYIKSLPHSDKI